MGGKKWWWSALFFVFLIILPYVLLSPSLKKDWALLDDPDTATYSLRAVEQIFTHLDFSGLYTPPNKVSGRFHPGIYLYLGIRHKLLGLDPFVNHLFDFFLLYSHLLFLHGFMYLITRRYRYSALGICLYLFYAQGRWSTAYYNWYSLMTFEPILLICFLISLTLFLEANRVSAKRPGIARVLLGVALFALGYAFFTKEVSFVFTGVTGLIFLLTLSQRTNVFRWKRPLALAYFIGAVLFTLLFFLVYFTVRTPAAAAHGYTTNYTLNPGTLVHRFSQLWFMLFQNYTLLLILLPASYLLRILISSKEREGPGKREVLQAIFLVWGMLSWGIFLPWKKVVERLFLIPTFCFAIFGALEVNGIAEFYLGKTKRRLEKTLPRFTVAFWGIFAAAIGFFVFGRLTLPVKIYATFLKITTVGFSGFICVHVAKRLWKRGTIDRLCARFFTALLIIGFIIFLFFGSIGAYNFNNKYDGIEGVLVRMVRKVSQTASPNAHLYFHLPKGHTYIGQMNYRLPLFENRPDLKAFAFSAKSGTVYKKGDIIIHHPWLSKPKNFPFFKYEGNLDRPKQIKSAKPYILGATYGELKRWIIAHFTFPRDPRVRFLKKVVQRNWWDVYVVLSPRLLIRGKEAGND